MAKLNLASDVIGKSEWLRTEQMYCRRGPVFVFWTFIVSSELQQGITAATWLAGMQLRASKHES